MKSLESFLIGCVIVLFLLILAKAANPSLLQPPPDVYECLCELEQLETDVVRHINKDGIETVTTFINIKDCAPYED